MQRLLFGEHRWVLSSKAYFYSCSPTSSLKCYPQVLLNSSCCLCVLHLGRAVGCNFAAQFQDPEPDDIQLIIIFDSVYRLIDSRYLNHGRRSSSAYHEQLAPTTAEPGPIWIDGHCRTHVLVQHSPWPEARSGFGSSCININASHTRTTTPPPPTTTQF